MPGVGARENGWDDKADHQAEENGQDDAGEVQLHPSEDKAAALCVAEQKFADKGTE